MRTGPLLATALGSAACTQLIHLALPDFSALSAALHGAIVAFVYVIAHKEGEQDEP